MDVLPPGSTIRNGVVYAGHVHYQIHYLAGISPLVVIPRHEFYEVIVQSNAGFGIEDAGTGFTDKVGRDDVVVCVPHDPFMGPSEAALTATLMSSDVAAFFRRQVKSTTFRSGITLPTAFAAPVLQGMTFAAAPRPPRQSFFEEPSTVFWVSVVA